MLLGRKPFDESEVRQSLSDLDVTVRTGTTIDDVGAVFDAGSVDVVIMGAGLDLDVRLAIVRAVFEASTSTSVHMKDRDFLDKPACSPSFAASCEDSPSKPRWPIGRAEAPSERIGTGRLGAVAAIRHMV